MSDEQVYSVDNSYLINNLYEIKSCFSISSNYVQQRVTTLTLVLRPSSKRSTLCPIL